MTDTSKRPEWLDPRVGYEIKRGPQCDYCRRISRRTLGEPWPNAIWLCNSPDCESAARKAIGGEDE